MADRPRCLVVVLGTATEVGKTWISAAALAELAGRAHRVAARKPAQSFDPADPHPTDADVLGAATGEPATEVCPPAHWYPVAMAPPMAADHLGRPPLSIDGLLSAAHPWPAATAVGLIETAGGPRSPLAHDGDALDLVTAVDPDVVVLVADAGLGTINAVRLCGSALGDRRPYVVLNRWDPGDELHRRNRDWLAADGFTVATTAGAVADHLEAILG